MSGSRKIATSPEGRLQQRLGAAERKPPAWRNAPLTSDSRDRVLAGEIDTSAPGTINVGTGLFTIVRNAVGDITVTFTTAFAVRPVVTFGVYAGGANATSVRHIAFPTTTTFRIQVVNGAGVGVDSIFNFIAIGSRG
jgi:hypothetical protein